MLQCLAGDRALASVLPRFAALLRRISFLDISLDLTTVPWRSWVVGEECLVWVGGNSIGGSIITDFRLHFSTVIASPMFVSLALTDSWRRTYMKRDG